MFDMAVQFSKPCLPLAPNQIETAMAALKPQISKAHPTYRPLVNGSQENIGQCFVPQQAYEQSIWITFCGSSKTEALQKRLQGPPHQEV